MSLNKGYTRKLSASKRVKKWEGGPHTPGPSNVWGAPTGGSLALSANDPRRATTGSAGLDIRATTRLILTPEMGTQVVESDFKGPLPEDTVGLLLGRSSMALSELLVHPGVIDADYNGTVKILVSSPRGITAISPGDKIAQILVLPSCHKLFGSHEVTWGQKGFGSSGAPLACVRLGMENRSFYSFGIRDKKFMGLLNTGADRSIINEADWSKDWPVQKADQTLRGLGIAHSPMCSAATLPWKDDEGHHGLVQPCVLKIPISLWGRDVLAQMNLKLTIELFYIKEAQALMTKSDYPGTGGLGKQLQGTPEPIPLTNYFSQRIGGPGLGFS